MSELRLECQGLACPEPVVKCKQAVESYSPDQLTIQVDNKPAVENVTRFLGSRGYTVTTEQNGECFLINASLTEATGDTKIYQDNVDVEDGQQKICTFITTDTIGHGDDTLGEKLMLAFLSTLPEMGKDLWRIMLVNGAVRMACHGSDCLEKLKELDRAGVSILVCGTCLEFYGLTDSKQVGETTNMLDIVTSLQLASKTIQI